MPSTPAPAITDPAASAWLGGAWIQITTPHRRARLLRCVRAREPELNTSGVEDVSTAAARLLGMDANRTGRLLEQLRHRRGMTLRELAAALYCDYSWLGNIQRGRRWPTERNWVINTDAVLGGGGILVSAWDADQQERAEAAATLKALEQARRESEELLVAPDGADLDRIENEIVHVAEIAGIDPYDTTIRHALDLRTELTRRTHEGAYRPEQVRDLYVALSRVYGILAYLTLDLGQDTAARAHISSAFHFADLADHDQLRAWARGTESLALRFTKDFEPARDAAIDGLRYVGASTGTAEPRLLCGLAASTANLGDSSGAVQLLQQADRVRAQCGPDELAGPLFGFSQAKQLYYHGFSLMWAEEPAILRRAVAASKEAIAAWQDAHSPGDETLTHIYLATACVRLGDLDGSMDAIDPILARPLTASFSWVKKRLNQLNELTETYFPDSQLAAEMRYKVQSYIATA